MSYKIIFHTHKGGTGKTMLCYNAALYIASTGRKVLCADLDPQGSLSDALVQQWSRVPDGGGPRRKWVYGGALPYSGTAAKDLFDPAFSLGDLRIMRATHGLDLLWMKPNDFGAVSVMEDVGGIAAFIASIGRIAQGYDFVFIDLPPTTTSFVLGVLTCADYFVIPQTVASNIRACTGEFEIISQLPDGPRRLLGIVVNQISRRSKEHATAEALLRSQLGIKVFRHVIHQSVTIDTSFSHNTPLSSIGGGYRARMEVERVVDEMLDRIAVREGLRIRSGAFKGTEDEAARIRRRVARLTERARRGEPLPGVAAREA